MKSLGSLQVDHEFELEGELGGKIAGRPGDNLRTHRRSRVPGAQPSQLRYIANTRRRPLCPHFIEHAQIDSIALARESMIFRLRPRQKVKQKQQCQRPEECEANVCQDTRSPGGAG